jgi:hypothetical protein
MDWKFEYTVDLMRMQRHDFMNYLQVVYGYIQINKPKEAVEYIKCVNNKMTMLSKIYNIDCSVLSVLLNDFVFQCTKYYIGTEFFTEIESIDEDVFTKDIDNVKVKFDRVFEWIINKCKDIDNEEFKTVSIEIIGNKDDFTIRFSNSKDIDDNNEISHVDLFENVYAYTQGNQFSVAMKFS